MISISAWICSAIYIALTGFLVLVGIRFENWSDGFAARTPDGPSYCRDLLSAGGDDDATLVLLFAFIFPLLLRFFRALKPAAIYEIVFHAICVILALFSLWLASLDCAEIFYTAFAVHDLTIILVFAGLVLSTGVLWVLFQTETESGELANARSAVKRRSN